VVALSLNIQEDVKDLCQAIGFVDVLHKPFNLESLCLAVRRAMVQEPDAAESGYSTFKHGAAS